MSLYCFNVMYVKRITITILFRPICFTQFNLFFWSGLHKQPGLEICRAPHTHLQKNIQNKTKTKTN